MLWEFLKSCWILFMCLSWKWSEQSLEWLLGIQSSLCMFCGHLAFFSGLVGNLCKWNTMTDRCSLDECFKCNGVLRKYRFCICFDDICIGFVLVYVDIIFCWNKHLYNNGVYFFARNSFRCKNSSLSNVLCSKLSSNFNFARKKSRMFTWNAK